MIKNFLSYIKLFESVDLYQKTNRMGYLFRLGSAHAGFNRPISGSDRNKLVSIFPVLRKPIESEKAHTSKTKLIYKRLDSRSEYGIGLRIDIDILTDHDEWFYVRVIIQRGINTIHLYFKCDQFDGLVECIKKEVISLTE